MLSLLLGSNSSIRRARVPHASVLVSERVIEPGIPLPCGVEYIYYSVAIVA